MKIFQTLMKLLNIFLKKKNQESRNQLIIIDNYNNIILRESKNYD